VDDEKKRKKRYWRCSKALSKKVAKRDYRVTSKKPKAMSNRPEMNREK